MFRKSLSRGVAIAFLATGMAALTTPSLAGAPEVRFDPVTGIAQPNPELEVALAAIEQSIRVAQPCWQCAPWIDNDWRVKTARVATRDRDYGS